MFSGENVAGNSTPSVLSTNNGEIKNCVFAVDLSSTTTSDPTSYGGMVSNNKGILSNCLHIGKFGEISGNTTVSATARENSGTIENCYYIEKENLYTIKEWGKACPEEELKEEGTYEGWDFEHIWEIAEGEGYPSIRADIPSGYLPTPPNITEVKLTYKISVEDVRYNKEEDTCERHFPLTVEGPVYAGSDSSVSENLDDILKTCEVKIEEKPVVEGQYLDQLREAIPRHGFKTRITDRNPASEFFRTSCKDASQTGYKIIFDFQWAEGEPSAEFRAGKEEGVEETAKLSEEQKEQMLADAKLYMRQIIDLFQERYPEAWKTDSWFGFTCARCGYFPGELTSEKVYAHMVKARYEPYVKEYEDYKAANPDYDKNATEYIKEKYPVERYLSGEDNESILAIVNTNVLLKDVLAFTAMGYDATNIAGLDLIDLKNNNSTSRGSFDGCYSCYSDYSGRYTDNYEEFSKKVLEQMDANEGYWERMVENTDADDMSTMTLQQIFLALDPENKDHQYKIGCIRKWFSNVQTIRGCFPGNQGYTNPWTNAQVHITMALCGIDWRSEEFVKNGYSVISLLGDPVYQANTLGYASDRLQCARALAALIRQSEGSNDLFDCTDVTGTRTVNRLIDKFKDAGFADIVQYADDIGRAREIYNGLHDSRKSGVRLNELEAAEKLLKDRKCVDNAAMKINAIPAVDALTLEEGAVFVAEARGAYDLLTEDQKKLLTEDLLQKLAAAEEKIAELKTTTLTEAIRDLEPGRVKLLEYLNETSSGWQMDQEFADRVKYVREGLYDPFVAQYPEQAAGIDIKNLDDSEQALAELVYNILKELPRSQKLEAQDNNENVDTENTKEKIDSETVEAENTEPAGEDVPEADDTEETDGQEAGYIKETDDPETDYVQTDESEETEKGSRIQVTEEELQAIADGWAAYQSLTDPARTYLEDMDGGAEEIANLRKVNELAGKYQAYVEQYQKNLRESIASIPLPMTEETFAKACRLVEQYNTEKLAREYIDDESNTIESGGGTVTLKSVMEQIRAGIVAIQEKLARIQKAEEMIGQLPLKAPVNKEEADAAKVLYNAALEFYNGLTQEEQERVVSSGSLTVQKTLLDNWNVDEASAAQAAELIRSAEELRKNIRSEQMIAALQQATDAWNALNERARTILGTEQADKLSVMAEEKKADTKAALKEKGITLDMELPWYVSVEADEVALSGPEAAPLVQVLKNQKRVTAVKAVSMKAYTVRADGSREEYSADTAIGINLPAVSGLSGKNVWIAVRYADESVGCIQGFAGQSGVALRSARFGVFVLGADTSDTSAGVEPDDIPQEGIPESFWIAKVADCTYTGKALKPAVRVYNGDKLLSEGTDYKLSYKNNINANVNADAKAVVTVTGRGNYTGTRTAEFTILPLDVNDRDIMIGDVVAAHTGSMLEAVPEVTYQGKKLVKERDFTLSGNTFAEEGTYDIILRGTGNFTGEATAKFTITKLNLISQATVAKIPEAARKYNGTDPVTPSLTVKVKKTVLKEGADYEVAFINNEEVGTATAILTGINEYAGTKKVNFQIVGTPLKKAVVTGLEKSYDYTGDPIEAEALAVTLEGKTLSEGTDYKVSYENNRRAGKAGVLIKGTGAYTGTIKKTFKITACDLKENEDKVSGLESLEARYTKGGSKPEIDLVFDGVLLTEGKDYTVACKNHKKVADAGIGKKAPKVTIKGKGDFKGTLTANFTIVPKALDDEDITFTVADVAFADKKGKYISKPVLTDAGGKKLTVGTDYERTVEYTLDGAPLTKQDIVPEGASVTVKVTGKGAYTGSREEEYRITRYSFNKAKVKISNQAYTGRAVTLDENDLEVKFGTEVLDYGDDYEIVEGSYTKNIKKGTAAVTIAGKGEYGGLKTVKFKIVSQNVTLK